MARKRGQIISGRSAGKINVPQIGSRIGWVCKTIRLGNGCIDGCGFCICPRIGCVCKTIRCGGCRICLSIVKDC